MCKNCMKIKINLHQKPKLVVSANAGIEPGRIIDFKKLLDQAIDMSEHKPKKCIFYNRPMVCLYAFSLPFILHLKQINST